MEVSLIIVHGKILFAAMHISKTLWPEVALKNPFRRIDPAEINYESVGED